MNTEPETNNKPASNNDAGGESMKDSMMESSPGNDNSLITPAEELTDENGKLNPDQLKDDYKPNSNNQNEENHGRQ